MYKILAKNTNLTADTIKDTSTFTNVLNQLDTRLDGLDISDIDTKDLGQIIESLKNIINVFGGKEAVQGLESIFKIKITEDDITNGRNIVVFPQDGMKIGSRKIEVIWE